MIGDSVAAGARPAGGRRRFKLPDDSEKLVAAPGGGLLTGLPDMEVTFDPADLRPSWEPNTQIALGAL